MDAQSDNAQIAERVRNLEAEAEAAVASGDRTTLKEAALLVGQYQANAQWWTKVLQLLSNTPTMVDMADIM